MTCKAMTTCCLAGLLLLAGVGQSFGQADRRTGTPLPQPAVRAPAPAATTPTPQHAAVDVTLRYFDIGNDIFDFNLGGDFRAVGTFFKAPFDGTLDRVDFEMSNFPPSPGIRGTGTLRIKLVRGEDILTPATPGVDSLDLNFSQLKARSFVSIPGLVNQVDVSNRNFAVKKDREYFLQLSLVNESPDAALTFVFDGGTEDSTDTRYFPARSFVYVLAASNPDTMDSYLHFVDNPNLLLELGLTRAAPPPPEPTGQVLFVHNALDVGAVDFYVGGQRLVNDLAFQQAASLRPALAGQRTLEVVAGSDADNSNPLLSTTTTIAANENHLAVALRDRVLLQPLRREEGDREKIAVLLVHGGVIDAGDGAVDVHRLNDRPDHAVVDTLAEGLAFGQAAGPVAVPDSLLNIALYAAGSDTPIDVYRLDLREAGSLFGASVLPLLTSGVLGATPPFSLFTVRENGTVVVAGACPSSLCVSTAADEAADPPGAFALYGNYPNPFNPRTTIRFDLAAPGFTTLAVYNLLGQEVAVLVAGHLPAGRHEASFDAVAVPGLPSGPYLYRLTSGRFRQQKMLMLVK